MMKLSEMSRKILRAMYKGLGVTAVSIVFNSCPADTNSGWGAYGMPPDYIIEEISIYGKVLSKATGEPLRNIAIYYDDESYYVQKTNIFGEFYIWLKKADSYSIIFTDIDGSENKLYKQKTIKLSRDKAEAIERGEIEFIIELEERTKVKEEEPEAEINAE